MTVEARQVNPGGFLEHRESLQRLARSLLAGADGADDLVQDTWLAARAAGDDAPRRTGAWLGGVLRNLVHKHRRGELRRMERERRAARDERFEAAGATLETRRRVVEAVQGVETSSVRLHLATTPELVAAGISKASIGHVDGDGHPRRVRAAADQLVTLRSEPPGLTVTATEFAP